MIITLTVFAKTVVIPNDNGMWMKIFDQEILYINGGILFSKSFSKGDHYQVVDTAASIKDPFSIVVRRNDFPDMEPIIFLGCG